MTTAISESERVFLLKGSASRGSAHFNVSSPDHHSWSHITSQGSKKGETSIELYPPGSRTAPAAIAREQKLSARPGVSESTQAIAGAFDVIDSDGNRLATFRKKPFRSVFRTTWDIEFQEGSHAVGHETNLGKILLRRFFMLLRLIIDIPVHVNSAFVFRDADGVLFTTDTASHPDEGLRVIVSPRADDRVALLQAVLIRTR